MAVEDGAGTRWGEGDLGPERLGVGRCRTGEVVGGRPEASDTVAEDVDGRAGDDQAVRRTPDEGEAPEVVHQGCDPSEFGAVEQASQCLGRDGLGADRSGFESLEVGGVEPVDRADGAGAGGAAGGESREVAGRRTGQIGPGREQGGELLVGSSPDVIGKGTDRRRGRGQHCPTVRPERPTSGSA
jgi:hypothetical protein